MRILEEAVNIKPIRTEADYQAALTEVAALMDARPETDAADRLDVLATLVAAYEARQFPSELVDPVDVIKFSMDQKGLVPQDLVPMIGRLGWVHEILNGTRNLSLPMIWKLHAGLGIPAELLIKPVQAKRKTAAGRKRPEEAQVD